MTTILQARFDENRLKKIFKIQADTGLTVSQLFRRLIDVAEVKPLEITADLSAPTTTLPTGTMPAHI